MSSSHAPTSPPSEGDDARTITYDPNDPFWRETETEEDDDDMEYIPASGGSDGEGDDDLEISFHGTLQQSLRVERVQEV
jgi:WD repeat-containing protein 23